MSKVSYLKKLLFILSGFSIFLGLGYVTSSAARPWSKPEPVFTPTPTFTVTPTFTSTPAVAKTNSPTATATATVTPSSTFTPTSNKPNTPTSTATSAFTSTPTPSPTNGAVDDDTESWDGPADKDDRDMDDAQDQGVGVFRTKGLHQLKDLSGKQRSKIDSGVLPLAFFSPEEIQKRLSGLYTTQTINGQLMVGLLAEVSDGGVGLSGVGATSVDVFDDVAAFFLPPSRIADLAALPGVLKIEADYIQTANLDVSLAETGIQAVHQNCGLLGQGVTIGVLDTGIDVNHFDFSSTASPAMTSKIAWYYSEGPGFFAAPRVPYVGTGTASTNEWSNLNLNTAAGRSNASANAPDRVGHGTHVASIAGSTGNAVDGGIHYTGAAPASPLIDVQIAPNGSASEHKILSGFNYFFNTRGGQVANLSFGGPFGPHDGSSLYETAVSSFIPAAGTKRFIVAAAGNNGSFNGLQRWHADPVMNPGVTGTEVFNPTGTAYYLIDGWYNAPGNICIQLVPPTGPAINLCGNGLSLNPGGAPAGLYGIWKVAPSAFAFLPPEFPSPACDHHFQIAIIPFMAGNWTIKTTNIRPAGTGPVRVDMWMGGISANAGLLPFDPYGSVTLPATANRVIAVGSYVTKASDAGCGLATGPLGQLSGFSGWGPTRPICGTNATRIKPDVTAPGEYIMAARSSQIAGAPPCSATALHMIDRGTSMAAPHVTGLIAMWMQDPTYSNLNYPGAINLFSTTSAAQPNLIGDPNPGVPNNSWGYGKIRATCFSVPTFTPTPSASCPGCGAGAIWNPGTSAAAFPGRAAHSSVVYDLGGGSGPEMWVIGGQSTLAQGSNDVWHSTNGVSWLPATTAAAFPARSRQTSLAFDGGSTSSNGLAMWVIGGLDNTGLISFNDVWYSKNGSTWTPATTSAAFSPRAYLGSLVFDAGTGNGPEMWVIGGVDTNTSTRLNDVWHSKDGINWVQATAHAGFAPLQSFSCVVFDAGTGNGPEMWVIGGFSNSVFNDVSQVWHSKDGVNWALATSTPGFAIRQNQTSVVFDNKMWVIGGLNPNIGSGIFYNDVWNSSDGVNWCRATAGAAFSPRYAHTSLVFNSQMWVIAGQNSSGTSLNDTWFSGCVTPPAACVPASGSNASVVVGQPNFTSNSSGAPSQSDLQNPYKPFTDGTRLFVVDKGNNRVLIYNSIPVVNGVSADVVIGQPNFTSGSANQSFASPNSQTLRSPTGGFSDGTRLFIADYLNNRVLIYNTIPTSNNAAADVVLGQPNFSLSQSNQGASVPSANTLFLPYDVWSDGTKLFVVDAANTRVLIYNSIPTANNTPADLVIGQPDMVSFFQNEGASNPSANTLASPTGVSGGGGKLFVSDELNNRVLVFNSIPTANNTSANVVIGQPGFTSSLANQGGTAQNNTLNFPTNISFDSGRLAIDDGGNSNNRVLIYNSIPATNGAAADEVIGQPNFTSTSINQGGGPTAATLSIPQGLYLKGNQLFVADTGNARVLIYNCGP